MDADEKTTHKQVNSKQFIQLVLFVSTRVIINTAYRMIYPFLPAFAAGMGVSIQQASLALTGRSLVAMAGPAVAPVADRYGRKTGMLLGLGLFTLGVSLVALWPSYPAFFAALVLANFGNQVFLPAMQAYLGDRLPYERRGGVLAVTEMSWSLSFIILVPLAGLLIARLGWASPFLFLSVMSLLALGLLALVLPSDRSGASARQTEMGIRKGIAQVFANPVARAALLFSLVITIANEIVNLVFGVWMNDSFQLDIAALGIAAMIVGAAELSGETATAVFVDRVGKKRVIRVGLALTSLASLALPLLGGSVWGALIGLFGFYMGFELALVSFIPLMTEVSPQARATLMAVNMATLSLGRAAGALSGSWLYTFGFWANAAAALALNLFAFILLKRIRAGTGED